LLLAIGVAFYLPITSWGEANAAGCGPESDCDRVLSSRWATWFGLPVSLLGLAVYLALYATSHAIVLRSFRAYRRKCWNAAVVLSSTVLVAALWFVVLQFAVIESVCKFCLLTHGSAGVGALFLLSAARSAAERPRRKRVVSTRRELGMSAALGAPLSLAILIMGQLLGGKQAYAVAQQPATSDRAHSSTQRLTVYGRFTLDPGELPVRGKPSASLVMVSLFDYTCRHCREMHELLATVERRYGERLAVIALPMPLDAECNRFIPQTPPAHANACGYARLALAVWRARPDAFQTFDDWLFQGEAPPDLGAAHAKARELVGADPLGRALSDSWVARQLATNTELYRANAEHVKSEQMPQIMVGDMAAAGTPPSADDIVRLLEKHEASRSASP
jgi:uncharacterized membrane protein